MSETNLDCGHFGGQSPSRHIVERFSKGAAFASEKHALEPAGIGSGFADSLQATAVHLALFAAALWSSGQPASGVPLILFAVGVSLWQGGRSAWLGWARLERLHRELVAERDEIETSRDQERSELAALYALKGFDSPLLEQVVDVLMADDDRLLRVMLEEELGMSLGVHEHPLKQGLGAGLGALVSAAGFLCALWLVGPWGAVGFSALAVGGGSLVAASFEGNDRLEAVVWNASFVGALLVALHYVGAWIQGG